MDFLQAIKEACHPVHTEESLQVSLSKILIPLGFIREYSLDSKNIIDFFKEGAGIEVKIKCAKMNLIRQLSRYAEFEEIKSLIVVTSKPTLAKCLPEALSGKPVTSIILYKSIL